MKQIKLEDSRMKPESTFYYRNNDYGVASTCDAEVLVEGNYFQNVDDPTLILGTRCLS
jgi:pectate lyase